MIGATDLRRISAAQGSNWVKFSFHTIPIVVVNLYPQAEIKLKIPLGERLKCRELTLLFEQIFIEWLRGTKHENG
jgi:hypothetical protein